MIKELWILLKNEGLSLFHRNYTGEDIYDPQLTAGFFTSIAHFAASLGEEEIKTMDMGNKRITYEHSENLTFVLVADIEHEIQSILELVRQLRSEFIQMFPFDFSLGYRKDVSIFDQFNDPLDEIISEFERSAREKLETYLALQKKRDDGDLWEGKEAILQRIVSSFSDYFINIAETEFDQRPTSIDFDDISIAKKIGLTGIRLMDIKYRTDLGRSKAALAVKFMKPEEVKTNVDNMKFLSSRLNSYKQLGLTTPEVIYQSDEGIMVMEGIRGESFRKSPVPYFSKLRMTGSALAALHGSEKGKIFEKRYIALTDQVLQRIPTSDSRKKDIKEFFSKRFELSISGSTEGGAISFGDFHPGNVLFEVNPQVPPILRAHLIDPEFLDLTPVIDRCEDICNFFVVSAIKEYKETGKLVQVGKDIRTFIAGYNEILARKYTQLRNFYTKEVPINFHLAQGILLSILNYLSMPETQNQDTVSEVSQRLALVELLLSSPSLVSIEKYDHMYTLE
ncbi:MAG: hypothetical protein ACFFCQ_05880 [Promethearchaeota archaeon]